MHASVPPHTAMSASSARIRRAASPIAWMPPAHAVTGAPSGPLKPWRIEMWPAARFTRKDGIVNGDRRRTPRRSTVRTASVMAGNPPMPEAMIVRLRAGDLWAFGRLRFSGDRGSHLGGDRRAVHLHLRRSWPDERGRGR